MTKKQPSRSIDLGACQRRLEDAQRNMKTCTTKLQHAEESYSKAKEELSAATVGLQQATKAVLG